LEARRQVEAKAEACPTLQTTRLKRVTCFGLTSGRRSATSRPDAAHAIVVSPRAYNEKSSLILVCPIARNIAAWPFKVEIPVTSGIRGAILVDQVGSIDRQDRFVRRAGRVQPETLDRVHAMLAALFGIPVSN
jgi:mRNA interferase MazF